MIKKTDLRFLTNISSFHPPLYTICFIIPVYVNNKKQIYVLIIMDVKAIIAPSIYFRYSPPRELDRSCFWLIEKKVITVWPKLPPRLLKLVIFSNQHAYSIVLTSNRWFYFFFSYYIISVREAAQIVFLFSR